MFRLYRRIMEDNSIQKENRNPIGFQITKPLVLVGLMGAGKSTVGRRLAGELAVPFVDSDTEIVEAAECSISDIFAIYGEEIFRDLEKRVMLRLLTGGPMVIATGGGAFMTPDIRNAIKEQALSVWLRADIEVLLERVSRRNTRPLLEGGDKREILSKMLQDRSPIYGMADLIVDNNAGEHEKVVRSIITLLEQKQVL
jgi:shikimate kinase